MRAQVRRVSFALTWIGVAVYVAAVGLRPQLEALLGLDAADVLISVVLFNVAYVAGAVCLLCCPASLGRREQWGWRLLALAFLSSTGAYAYHSLVLADLDVVPVPSWSDALWLAWYPAGYVAIVFLLTARVGRFPLSIWLDGLVAGAGVAAIAAALWFEPLTEVEPGTPLLTVVVNMAYPVVDLLLVAMLVGVAYMVRSALSWWLVWLLIGFALNGVTDVLTSVAMIAGTYAGGSWLDIGWPIGIAALVTASVPRRHESGIDALDLVTHHRGVSLRMMGVPLASSGASLALLVVGQGSTFPVVVGAFAGACIVGAGIRTALTFRDVARLADVHREARTDDLTRLANRRALYEEMTAALATADRTGVPTSLLLIDLDGFKEVNDSLGHAVGDELLRAFAHRMQQEIAGAHLLARLGGDEFAVLVAGADETVAEELAWRLVARTAEPFEVDVVRLSIDASIGVASLAPGSGSRGDLLRQADVAMYQAKGSSTRVACFAADEAADTGPERLALLTRLREGLTPHSPAGAGQIELHLQPKVSLQGHRLEGVEALARWRDHDGLLLQPAEFLPLVQRGGLLPALATRVLLEGVRAARLLRDAGAAVPVSVNLTAVDIHDQGLPGRVAAVLREEGLEPHLLVIELTEDSLVTDPDAATRVLRALRELGVRISLDDFGTGYCSLSYLRQLPVDEVKLDRSFTNGVGQDAAAEAVIEHTVGLVHALGLRLVAEGVEDLMTADRLRELGCDTGQGFLWARPQPVDALLSSVFLQSFDADEDADADGGADGGAMVRPRTPSDPVTTTV